jgi:hypothetical protein
MQAPILIAPAQRMKSPFALTVLQIVGQQQGLVEEDLLGLGFGDAVLFVLPGVAIVPVKPDVEHRQPLYMFAIYRL